MERIILRDHIKEAIKNRKVVAAVFHTFNFDPLFFENFVMPLFVPGKDFRDEAIYNKILWRYCAKENLIPPVAVFCDYYAKDNTQAPTLGYDINCLKVPSAVGAICNFHPKHILILVEDENGNRTLLFITGSGNLTPTGWCDNFECFSVLEIKPSKTHPNRTSTNPLQNYIDDVGRFAGLEKRLDAEEIIHEFLKYVDFDIAYYNSLASPFINFLEQHDIFTTDDISEVEIVSPYFSNDTALIKLLQSKNVKRIKCLIPTLRTNEILLNKETFVAFQNAGLEWSYWADAKYNTEVRNQHSKIYRFYGIRHCYTFIGSVNFTQPAWVGYSKRNNKGNIESGVLYVDPPNATRLLKKVANLDIESLLFLEKEDLENSESANRFDRNAPNIEFIIDWKNKSLRIQAKIEKRYCKFYKSFDDAQIENYKSEIILSDIQIRQLAKNSLIKVSALHQGTESVYSYYPGQVNLDTKPLGFKLDAATVLKYWQFFNDENERQKITKGLAEKATDESGVIDEKRIETQLLLNEMATHFSGLAKLEKYLFNEKLSSQEKIKLHFSNLQYYLLSENIDTIPFYLNDLKQQQEQVTIQKSFYWMVLQIINQIIYSKAEKWEHSWALDKTIWKQFKSDIRVRKELLSNDAGSLENDIPGLNQKASWVLEQLVTEYD
ncbi:MAG: hypothetical protein ABI112_10225 [Terracoccus sp.]